MTTTPAPDALPEPAKALWETIKILGLSNDRLALQAIRAAIDAAVAEARAVPEQVQLPYFNRREVERQVESSENPSPGTLRFNDSKERVTLPGGTLRRMLQIIDMFSATTSPTMPAREALSDERIAEIITRHIYDGDAGAAYREDWTREIGTPLVRAVEAAHGITPAQREQP